MGDGARSYGKVMFASMMSLVHERPLDLIR
jgi:hypothetical protein